MPIRKKGDIDIRTSANGAKVKQTSYTFYSYDKKSAALYFQFREQDGQPTDLGKATIHLVMILNDDGGEKFIPGDDEIEVISAIRGTAKYVLPEMLLSYEGKITGYVYMDFDDGSQSDDGQFTFRIKQSMITHVLPEAGDKYVQDFEDVKERVEQAGDSATKDIKQAKDNAENQIGDYVGEVESAKDSTIEDIDKALLVDEAKKYTDDKVEEFNETITKQLAQTKSNMYKADVYQSLNEISYKAVYNKKGTIFVVTKNPKGKGYLRFRISDGNYSTTQSVGSPAELKRIHEVRQVLTCFLLSNKVTSTSGEEWIDNSLSYVIGATAQTLPVKQTNGKSIDSWIEYTVETPKEMIFLTALIYGSAGSPTNATISVDGVDVLTNLDLSDPDGAWKEIDIPIDKPGTHIVRFTTLTDSYFTVAGFKVDLDEYVEGFSFSEIITLYTSSDPYVYASGAMEYALLDSDSGLWCGSYHGGEIRNRLQYLLDGKEIALNAGDVQIGKTFEVEQDTSIVDKIDAYSVQTFKQDGTIEHSVVFDGNINLTRLFTNMSTTSDAFTEVMYPERLSLISEGNYRLPPGINYIVQKNPSTNQKAVTILNNNMFPADKQPDPYIKLVNGAYSKVYNDNIHSDVPVNFTGGNFRTVHIFE